MDRPTAALEALLVAEQGKLQRALLARNTQIGYAYDWAMFDAWCAKMQRQALPATPETVSLYLTDLLTQGKKVSTATRRTSAITSKHRTSGFETPVTDEIRRLLKGARRLRGEQPRQMRPLTVENLRAIADKLTRDGSARAIRDRAILVIGLASALRRDNLVSLDLADVEFRDEGVVLHVRREKQDQEGHGRCIGLPKGKRGVTCPVRCLRAWLKLRGDAPGPLFTHAGGQRLGPQAMWVLVKAAAASIGLEGDYGPHSMRAGFITAAGEHGVSTLVIAAHTGHHSMSTLQRYFRGDVFRANACTAIGL